MNNKIEKMINTLKQEITNLSKSNINNSNVEKTYNNIAKLTKIVNCMESYNKNNETVLNSSMKKNFNLVKVSGNGSCFYSAIGVSLKLTKNDVKNEIIQRVYNFFKLNMRNNGETNNNLSYGSNSNNSINQKIKKISINEELKRILNDTFHNIIATNNDYINKKVNKNDMKNIIVNDINNKWGGFHILELVSFVFNITIMVYNPLFNKMQKIKSNIVNSNKIVYLYYNGRDHYDGLLKKNDA